MRRSIGICQKANGYGSCLVAQSGSLSNASNCACVIERGEKAQDTTNTFFDSCQSLLLTVHSKVSPNADSCSHSPGFGIASTAMRLPKRTFELSILRSGLPGSRTVRL